MVEQPRLLPSDQFFIRTLEELMKVRVVRNARNLHGNGHRNDGVHSTRIHCAEVYGTALELKTNDTIFTLIPRRKNILRFLGCNLTWGSTERARTAEGSKTPLRCGKLPWNDMPRCIGAGPFCVAAAGASLPKASKKRLCPPAGAAVETFCGYMEAGSFGCGCCCCG